MSNVTINKGISKGTSVTSRQPLPCGTKTPRRSFVFPILVVLNELGGSAPISEVMSLLEQRMRSTLVKVDYDTLNSDNHRREPRWRNTARWAKDSMVKLGFISGTSQRGIWEITSFGYEVLQETR